MLQKRALRLDKILLGYQHHSKSGETVVNPKDKYKIKSWDDIGKCCCCLFVRSLFYFDVLMFHFKNKKYSLFLCCVFP